ncbi:hypothetical protein P280DRAFT_494877 [Massarina eburnea CBS 473.64]|uniref:FAD-binding FR-type domain-containing protein n=1 Tax=Massarina eburnea CBS 473.64 TaxID=1395130 RepID=A0A6A6SJZ2_9PLEO|nr:hypothetical protein P280DRAFT_494877 [Massarina eburnea CBS 473.64]
MVSLISTSTIDCALDGKAPKQEIIDGEVWIWITTRNVLVTIALLANIITLTAVAAQSKISPQIALDAVSTNILLAVLVRNEHILNFLYWITTLPPHTYPLALRRHLANLHHNGGVHMGCAISSLLWYIGYMYFATKDFVNRRIHNKNMSPLIHINLVTCYAFIVLLVTVCLTALPRFRPKHHNSFEKVHRFGGWAAVAVFWVHAGIGSYLSKAPLRLQPNLWLVLIITVLLIYPWLRVRCVDITATRFAMNSTILTFPYENMPAVSTMRFSMSPLVEWHAFATLPDFPSTGQSSIVISEAGDWTSSIITSPPTHLYLRNLPVRNFLLSARMFRTVLLVATGAGIGPVLSYLESISTETLAGQTIRVLWCARNPYGEPWAFARDIIHRVDPAPRILDSRPQRPDIVREARVMMETEKAEACFVVSNRKVTSELVGVVQGDGGAAFGASFDS